MPRRRRRPARRYRATRWLVLVVVVLLLPVPWLHLVTPDPPGAAWRLNGRLVVDGRTVDPPGRWTWLTVGRPPLVAEVLRDRLVAPELPARDLRDATLLSRPSVNEPAAAAVGRHRAGVGPPLGLLVEAHGATRPGFPDPAVIVALDGQPLTSRADWEAAADGPLTSLTTADGVTLALPDGSLPYGQVLVVDVAPEGLSAAIGGSLDRLPPVRWLRKLALGRSHGLMVALITYADAAGHDLARGRHIAGTGTILADGTVGRIGGLQAKAAAARRAGAEVLLVPAVQAEQLAGFDPRGMQVVPVATLDEAIAALSR